MHCSLPRTATHRAHCASITGATPLGGAGMVTPVGGAGLMTPVVGGQVPMTPEQWQAAKWQADVDRRNRPMTDEELDALLPVDGYKVLDPPAGYAVLTWVVDGVGCLVVSYQSVVWCQPVFIGCFPVFFVFIGGAAWPCMA